MTKIRWGVFKKCTSIRKFKKQFAKHYFNKEYTVWDEIEYRWWNNRLANRYGYYHPGNIESEPLI